MAEAERLEFALTHLRSSEWEAFERLCNAFLAEDFPGLRVLAGVGDEGRDAIFDAPDRPAIVVQFSVARDWRAKIKATLRRLEQAEHPCSILIYATNQEIGPQGDALKTELMLDGGVSLDIRDRSYFVGRVYRSPSRKAAAEDLSQRVIAPLLPSDEVTRHSAVADPDMRAGLLYLELQMRDVDEGRNISKLSIDNIVLAALRDTDRDNRRTRGNLVDAATRMMPSADPEMVRIAVDGSVNRLKTRAKITLVAADDSFALHHREQHEREEKAVELLAEREKVRAQLIMLSERVAGTLDIPFLSEGASAFVDALEAAFEAILAEQGNKFAEAVRSQTPGELRSDVRATAEDVVARRYKALRSLKVPRDPLVEMVAEAVTTAFVSASGPVRSYLRELADAYTLLAFMQEAPDVQRAVSRFFSRGRLLLDTTVLLPCFAESVLLEDDQRFTNLLRGALEAGMSLDVTNGVVNEINAHLDLSLLCYRMNPGDWKGNIPRVYADWSEISGSGDFRGFVDRFRGDGGEQDIRLFLEQALGINLVDLEAAADRFPQEQRGAVAELWRPRKRIRPTGSEIERDILLRHDIEMYFGTLARRQRERLDFYGYEAWWVTTDGTAIRMFEAAQGEDVNLPSNPCMTPNFLTNLLAIGPTRGSIGRTLRTQLPVALDIQRHGLGVPGLSAKADEIRAANAGEPEWLVRRRIRERMNELKAMRGELGPVAEALVVDDGESATTNDAHSAVPNEP